MIFKVVCSLLLFFFYHTSCLPQTQQMDQWQREREKKIILEKRLLQEERLKSDHLNYSVGDTVLQYGEAQDLDANGKCDWISKK